MLNLYAKNETKKGQLRNETLVRAKRRLQPPHVSAVPFASSLLGPL